MKLERINLGGIWTMIVGTAAGVVYMFNTFAIAADVERQVNELELSINYGQFYDRLDDRDEAVDEGNADLAEEYERQMEKLRAKICESDSAWERCDP